MGYDCQIQGLYSWLDVTESYPLYYTIVHCFAGCLDHFLFFSHLVGGHIGSDEVEAVSEVTLLSAEVGLGTEGLDTAKKFLNQAVGR